MDTQDNKVEEVVVETPEPPVASEAPVVPVEEVKEEVVAE